MKQNYDLTGALLSALTCITGWVVVALILVSCSKEYNPEPQPADKRVQEQVKKLQGWGDGRKILRTVQFEQAA